MVCNFKPTLPMYLVTRIFSMNLAASFEHSSPSSNHTKNKKTNDILKKTVSKLTDCQTEKAISDS